ncbi:MAG: ATP-binding protein [Parvularculaceae bacterium]
MPSDTVMRMRAVWVIGLMVAVSQMLNIAVMTVIYGGVVYDHIVDSMAVGVALAVIVSVRWCKNAMVYALFYSFLMFGAVLGTALPDKAGINSAVVPFIALGPIMTGFMAGKRVAVAFWAAGLVVLGYLFFVSLANPSMIAPFDYTRETNRFFQAVFALSISTGIAVLITEQIYSAMVELRENALRAQRAEAVKSEFLATMSHELRTPLNGVLGLTDALVHSKLPEREAMLARTIRKSGESLLLILNDLLDLSKIEAGKLAMEPRPTDLRDLVRFVADSWREAAAAKGLSLSASITGAIPPAVMIDDLRLRQVLQNLVSNAVKFTNRGRVTIAIHGKRVDRDTTDLEIRVTDTGKGVPPDMTERIFEAFEQGEAGVARQFGGTGLGLPICRMLAELMGGEISLERSGPDGSVFLVRLPVIDADDDEGLDDDVYDAANDLHGVRVLVAEDNEVNRLVVNEFLKSWGAFADFAPDGPQCLAKLAVKTFDVIIMDKHMPGMNGMDTAAAIRSSGARYAKIPIIAATADAMPGEREAMLAAGMNEFIAKPLRADALKAVILRAIKSRAA